MVKIKGDRSMFIYLAIIDSPEGKLKFEVIYERYKGLMFYTANSVLGDTRDSEDIVHDAFLKIIEIIDEIDDPKSPQTRYLTVSSLLYLIGKAAFRVECQFTVGYAFVVYACQCAKKEHSFSAYPISYAPFLSDYGVSNHKHTSSSTLYFSSL